MALNEEEKQMRNKLLIAVCFIFLFISTTSLAQTPSDYLICQDIGGFKKYGCACGSGAGILGPTGHFKEDHNDTSCDVTYHSMSLRMGINVQVTQHAGSDSDRWLLHEVERGFRFGDYEEDMTPSRVRNIDGNKIFYTRLGGGTYRWISNNVVISIQYTDLYQQKTEPLEVVQVYLTKFPSTIPAITVDQAHNEQWIKDEMDRRLWLCDKWFTAQQAGTVELTKTLREAVDHMNVFLDYREKYYGIEANDEKNLLWQYLQANNEAGIKAKLQEYKTWWAGNKDKAINL